MSAALRKTFAGRVRDLMDARADLDTQVKVAQRSGVGQSTVARILASDTAATLDSVEAIAAAFGVAPAALLAEGAQEWALLRVWLSLTTEDRDRIVGYARIASGTGRADKKLLDYEEATPLTPAQTAAARRASARPPLEEVEDAKQQENANAATRRRPGAG